MKTFYLIGAIVFSIMLLSCGQKKEITYKKYKSTDKSYSIEIPSNAVQKESEFDFVMSFEDEHAHLLISIRPIFEKSIGEHIHNINITDNTFEYNLFQSSDTTSFYKVTRGNNMWSAYNFYMLKKIEGKNYLINVSSDVLGRAEMIEMIKHIHSSMKPETLMETADTTSVNPQTYILEKSYTTKFYTIKYPKQWEIIEQLNEMTDVYIGSPSNNFGFTVVRFETDYTLEEVEKEESANLRQAGIKVSDSKQVTIDGVKCLRAIHELNVQGQKVKHISYTFMKGNMLYNIKFGSVTVQAQETLANMIVNSFHFK